MKVKIPGFIAAEALSYNSDRENVVNGVRYTHFPFPDMAPLHGQVKVMPYDLEVEIPDNFDIRPGLVEGLKQQRTDLAAEFQQKVTQIDRQIAQILALEMA